MAESSNPESILVATSLKIWINQIKVKISFSIGINEKYGQYFL